MFEDIFDCIYYDRVLFSIVYFVSKLNFDITGIFIQGNVACDTNPYHGLICEGDTLCSKQANVVFAEKGSINVINYNLEK